MEITKVFEFDSAHRLINEKLSEEENIQVFGKCYNAPCHGHRWSLHVTIEGDVDEKSGMVVNFTELKKIVNEAVIDKFDHHYLNEVEELKGVIPTCENIIPVIWKMLVGQIYSVTNDGYLSQYVRRLKRLTLYETPTSYVTYEGKHL